MFASASDFSYLCERGGANPLPAKSRYGDPLSNKNGRAIGKLSDKHLKPMKRLLTLAALLLAISPLTAGTQRRIAGTPLGKFTIVYASAVEDEEGIDIARALQQQLVANGLPELTIMPDSAFQRGKALRILPAPEKEPFGYGIQLHRGDLTINGGSNWALTAAANLAAEMLAKGDIPRSCNIEGSVEGEQLFFRTTGTNLRILADNIWDYSRDDIPEAWQALGEDPRDDVRAPQFAQLARAYMPDVLNLQEYSLHMHERFYPLIRKYGYKIAWEGKEPWNNTPIFYNPETVELVDVNYVLYTPAQWSNKGSKSFTSAVFRQKASGKLFAVLNTHLWWKVDAAQPGSTYARTAQVNLMMAEAEILKAKYGCTIFVTGDMNAYEDSLPIRQFLDGGYLPCYKVATDRTHTGNGHHVCSPKEGYSRQTSRRSLDREEGAIDHCFIHNAREGVVVKAFDCVTSRFTIKLTDHYPYLIDVAL